MAFNLFKAKSKLGIDIGTSSIKVVELSQENGRWKLENYAMYELHSADGHADTAKTVMDLSDDEIAQAIKETIATAGMKSREAVASVSAFSTFATVIEMPYVSEEDLAKTIPFEARKYVPIPLDQVVLDWSIIGVVDGTGGTGELPSGPVAPGTSVTVEVFLAAVPKDETARYQRIMRAAGVNLVALELENSSLVRALLGNDLSPTAILNVGGRSTSILIVSKGYERLSHNYEIGGYEITKAIASALSVSLEQAEGLKRKYGVIDSPENKARAAMMPLIDMMVFETNKTIEAFEQARKSRISRVVLIGGLANMPGLAQYVKQRIPRDVLIGNVFARLVHPEELAPLVQTLSNTLAIAVGCAMRET
ncbi:MAG: type IV pilus assembly protein PilM [Candidatus Yanofskybacteria bacterium]|nr:type IV pilus assembly protein PilM [Candidatus Yanofskybacteria bacterium]